MHMERAEAREEIRKLLDGELDGRAPTECTLCYACNQLCPVAGLEPSDLLQQRILERRGGIPPHLAYFLNTIQDRSVWSDVYARLSTAQHEILERWRRPPDPAPEVLWIGCLSRSASCTDIDQSRVLAGLPKYGPYELCCGEVAYRLGGWESFLATAGRTREALLKLRTQRLVCHCSACMHTFKYVYPKVFGEPLPFAVTSIYEWLWERLQAGELELVNPLGYEAAVCESCNMRQMGTVFAQKLRELYRAAGMQLRELEHRGVANQTCGFAAMGRPSGMLASMAAMLKEQRKKYGDVKAQGTRTMALNCPGCFITFSYTNQLFGKQLKYMPEELLRAFGDTITEPVSAGFKRFFRIFLRKTPGFLLGHCRDDADFGAASGTPGAADSTADPPRPGS
jgi:Fe-S oxidoreductase